MACRTLLQEVRSENYGRVMIKMISFERFIEMQSVMIDSVFAIPVPDHLWLVEVGPSNEFDREHIRRAIHMNLDQVRDQASSRIPNRGVQIFLYGRDASEAARELESRGYYNLFILGAIPEATKREWMRETLPRESSLVAADGFIPKIVFNNAQARTPGLVAPRAAGF